MFIRYSLATALLLSQTALAFNPGLGTVLSILQKRQVDPGSITESCQSQCATTTTVPTCSPLPECICTEDRNKDMVNCMNCILATDGSGTGLDTAEADSLQLAVSSFEDTCRSIGHALNSLTVSGFDGNTQSLPEFSTPVVGNPTLTSAGSSPTSKGSSPSPTLVNGDPPTNSGSAGSGTGTGDAVMQFTQSGPLVALIFVLSGAFLVL